MGSKHAVGGMTDEELGRVPTQTLRQYMQELQGLVTDIQTSMSVAVKKDERGNPLTYKEYREWRHRAQVALNHTLRDLRRVKDALKSINRETYTALLGSVVPLTRALLRELKGYTFDQPEDAGIRRAIAGLARAVFDRPEELEEVLSSVGGGS